MFTRCPQCETVLRIEPKQLAAADGLVRCGNCQTIFDAQDALLPEEEVLALAPLLGEEPESAAGLPAAEPPPWARKAPRRRSLAPLGWGLGIVPLLGLLFLSAGYFYTAQLAAYVPLRPLLERLCEATHCVVPPRRAPERITIRAREVVNDPAHPEALTARVVMVNEADFPQPYPVVELTLNHLDGSVAGSRRFAPEEYLQPPAAGALMQPGEPVTVELELVNPGDVTGFRFRFL